MTSPNAWKLEQVMSVAQSTLARLEADGSVTADTDEAAILALLATEGADVDALLRGMIRAAIEVDSFATAIEARIDDLKIRAARHQSRKQAWRGAAFAAMDALGLTKLTDTDFTASISAGRSGVTITDADALPDTLVEIVTTRKPRIAEIKTALADGEVIDGAEIRNGAPSLIVRVK